VVTRKHSPQAAIVVGHRRQGTAENHITPSTSRTHLHSHTLRKSAVIGLMNTCKQHRTAVISRASRHHHHGHPRRRKPHQRPRLGLLSTVHHILSNTEGRHRRRNELRRARIPPLFSAAALDAAIPSPFLSVSPSFSIVWAQGRDTIPVWLSPS
jgi:hypothetical protein